MESKIRAIITGSTGMVGEGVLHECLLSEDIEVVLVINRKPCGIVHPKLKEILHQDFFSFSAIEAQLQGYNAAYFCLGISSIGVKNDEYYKFTYTLTMHVASTLSRLNSDMTFCYISGAGTDSTEKGPSHWARVKGKTENDLMKLPFHKVFVFRPGFLKPIDGLQQTHSFYKFINWVFPIGRSLYPNGFCKLEELGRAMIHAVKNGYDKNIIEGKDIIKLAQNQ